MRILLFLILFIGLVKGDASSDIISLINPIQNPNQITLNVHSFDQDHKPIDKSFSISSEKLPKLLEIITNVQTNVKILRDSSVIIGDIDAGTVKCEEGDVSFHLCAVPNKPEGIFFLLPITGPQKTAYIALPDDEVARLKDSCTKYIAFFSSGGLKKNTENPDTLSPPPTPPNK